MFNRSRLLVLRTSVTTVRALAPFPHRHLQSFRAVAAVVPVMSSGLKTPPEICNKSYKSTLKTISETEKIGVFLSSELML